MPKDIRKTLRFSQSEFELVQQQLEKSNITFSDFARSAILKHKIKLPIERELLFEINKIGNNLNQIAKATNQNPQSIEILASLVTIQNQLKELQK